MAAVQNYTGEKWFISNNNSWHFYLQSTLQILAHQSSNCHWEAVVNVSILSLQLVKQENRGSNQVFKCRFWVQSSISNSNNSHHFSRSFMILLTQLQCTHRLSLYSFSFLHSLALRLVTLMAIWAALSTTAL